MTSAEVTIDSIAAGGDGVGRVAGVVVFVPRTAPGDRALISLDTRKRFARGVVSELLASSPVRVDPLCYHYRVDRCGGCQIQHLRYSAQLEAKQAIVRDALTRIGKRGVGAPEIVPSRKEWRYRTKLTLTMKRALDASGDDGWRIGLRPHDDPAVVFQLSDCPITDERVMTVWRQVMEARAHFPPAEELRASVRLIGVGPDDGAGTAEGAAVVMEGGNAWPARALFSAAVTGARTIWWKPAHRPRMLVAERGAGAAGGTTGASASFAQVNAEVGALLHEYVVDRARSYRPAAVIDAYAGVGATAIPLARGGVKVVAIESDRDAAARCAAELPDGSHVLAMRVEAALPAALPADVVLINPPRTGIHESVAALLQGAPSPRAVIYVSCDPATLARDLRRMPRFQIASLRAFDMFPQTAHVETVCELVPESETDGARS